MTIALVQSKSATATSPNGLAFDTTPTSGGLLLCGWTNRNGVDRSAQVVSGFSDSGEGLAGSGLGFGAARLHYKKSAGTESGNIFGLVDTKDIVWIAEFSGVDVDTTPQHSYFMHHNSGDRINATATFTVSGDALLIGFHYGENVFAPISLTTELFDRNTAGVETPQTAASYRIVSGAGTYTVGETQMVGQDNLATFGMAFGALAGGGGTERSQGLIVI